MTKTNKDHTLNIFAYTCDCHYTLCKFNMVDFIVVFQALPNLERLDGLKLPGQAFADLLMTLEFLHTFADALGLGKSCIMFAMSTMKRYLSFGIGKKTHKCSQICNM